MRIEEIINALESEYKNIYQRTEYLPEPYVENIEDVRVIVLGCDPSNKSGERFKKAFGLDKNLKYFRGINKNLERIGLNKTKIYVDNLCKNYFKKETCETYEHRKSWLEIANKFWITYLKDQLNKVLPIDVPVLATSDIILEALCFHGYYYKSQNENYYKECMSIRKNENKLGRQVIPFFRHYKYSLDKWKDYSNYIKGLF